MSWATATDELKTGPSVLRAAGETRRAVRCAFWVGTYIALRCMDGLTQAWAFAVEQRRDP